MPRHRRAKTSGQVNREKADKEARTAPRRPGFPTAQAGALALQHSAGNQAVNQLLESATSGSLNEGDRPGGSNEALERQADRVAEQISLSPETPAVESALPNHQPHPEGGGDALPQQLRDFFESEFNQDFSGVRIHTGADAAESSQALDALAYTTGRDIFFAAGQYSPNTRSGKKLLAHELAHVVQQQAGSFAPTAVLRKKTTLEEVKEVESLHIEEDLKPAVVGAEGLLKKKLQAREKAIKEDLENVMKSKGQKWADEKIKALEKDLKKDVDEIIQTPDSKYVSKDLRAAIKKTSDDIKRKTGVVEKGNKQWHRLDDVFASKEVVDTLSPKGFTAADLKALIGQESLDLTKDDQEGDIAGIAQMNKEAVKEVGGKPADRLVEKKAIPLAAKVLIKKATQLEKLLKPVPTGTDFKKFVFASYNAGAATIAEAQKQAVKMKRKADSWDELVAGDLKSPLAAGIKEALPKLNTASKYKETKGYVERIFKRLGG